MSFERTVANHVLPFVPRPLDEIFGPWIFGMSSVPEKLSVPPPLISAANLVDSRSPPVPRNFRLGGWCLDEDYRQSSLAPHSPRAQCPPPPRRPYRDIACSTTLDVAKCCIWNILHLVSVQPKCYPKNIPLCTGCEEFTRSHGMQDLEIKIAMTPDVKLIIISISHLWILIPPVCYCRWRRSVELLQESA